MKEWSNRHPVVIVPTKYHNTATQHFQQLGISLIIWANHNLRASLSAMQQVSKQIFEDQHLQNVEGKIAPVNEVFRLQNVEELKQSEKKYLPQK
jgi:phosphoenolpyruvate phosphomutase